LFLAFQASIIPQEHKIVELRAVLIKAQHNMVTNHVRYASMQFPKIMHEYVVLWQRLPSLPMCFSSLLLPRLCQRKHALPPPDG
jgi:hypothetical protein